jgi:hypothetical protein
LVAAKCLAVHGRLEVVDERGDDSLWNKLGRLQEAVRSVAPNEIGACLPLVPEGYRSCIKDVWRRFDGEGSEMFLDARAVGYAYQYFRLPSRKDAQLKIQTADKQLHADQVAAFTQLYTPFWIVDFLVQNTVLPQLPAELRSHLPHHWLIENSSSAPQRPIDSISILDPACGGGHFLQDAFLTLVEGHKSTGHTSRDAADKAIDQIHGADIDGVALHAAALTLLVQYILTCDQLPGKPWNCFSFVGTDLLGSLSRAFPQDHPLSRLYSVVVTNPPYIGRRLITRELKTALKREYPGSAHDLAAPFVVRGLELLEPGGRLGFITQASLLSLPSFEPLRLKLIESESLKIAVELGTGVFPLQSGDKVNSVLLVAQASGSPWNGGAATTFIDLSQKEDKEESLRSICHKPEEFSPAVFLRRLSEFITAASSAFHYKCPPAIRQLLLSSPRLESIADVRQGLATTDNRRFLRHIWEVDESEIGKTWFPYVKGAGSERWTSPVLNVVNFAEDGREIKDAVAAKYPYLKGKTAWVVKNEQYYFRPGLCFSFVSTEQFGARVLPAGCIFDVAASALFPPADSSDFLLAYLNSTLIRSICKLVNPTINMQVGDVKRLPLLHFSAELQSALAQLGRHCVELKAELDSFIHPQFRSSDNFQLASILGSDDPASSYAQLVSRIAVLHSQLQRNEATIDELILQKCDDLLALSTADRESITSWSAANASQTFHHPATLLSKAQFAELAVVQTVMQQSLKRKSQNGSSACQSNSVLSPIALEWVEEALGTPLSSFSRKRLADCAAKSFKGTPPACFEEVPVSITATKN